MRELLDELAADAAGGGQLLAGQFRHDVDLEDLPAAVLDHLGDGGLLGAGAADRLLHVAAGVVLAVGREDGAAHCELGVGAVGPRSGLEGELVHLFQAVGLHIAVVYIINSNFGSGIGRAREEKEGDFWG